uniref:Cytochrome b561 domain-containing protein n=1 Tax=Leersia perrieri TaxID=77586 RepID=A0A0D9V8Y7_9ORYZ
MAASNHHTHRAFLLCSYALLGAASASIFLTLSLRLLPSPCGLLLIFLHALTAVFSAAGCSGSFTAPSTPPGLHNAHTAGAALTAIFQGAVALLAFTRTSDFLSELQSYVRDEDGAVILKMVGGLGTAIFVLEWAALALAFSLRLDDGDDEDDGKNWASSYHV